MTSDTPPARDQLWSMHEQLSSMIEAADILRDHLLGALLCDAQARAMEQIDAKV